MGLGVLPGQMALALCLRSQSGYGTKELDLDGTQTSNHCTLLPLLALRDNSVHKTIKTLAEAVQSSFTIRHCVLCWYAVGDDVCNMHWIQF